MAKHLKYDEFFVFESPAEEKSAQILASGTIQHIKNQIFTSKHLKENLVLDPLNPMAFAQQHAFHTGAISAYQYLLDCHDALMNIPAAE